MKIQVGQPAPNFRLYDSEKNLVDLSEQKGNHVLLLFFPLAFTRVCTEELCNVRDNLGFYNEVNTRVFGISVDSLHSLKRYKADQGFNFTLLSDFNRTASADYGCIYEEFSYHMKAVSKRAAFIIDGNGIVRYAEVLDDAEQVPDFEAIQQILSVLV